MRRDIDLRIDKLAGPRFGVFSRAEAYAAGADRHLIQRRVRSGLWIDHGCGALTLSPVPASLAQRRWIALMSVGPEARISHEAAADLYEIRSVPPGLVVLIARNPLHLEVPGAVIHQLGDLAPHHCTEVGGFPATTPARTIIDLAAVVSRTRLRRAIEDVIAAKLTTYGEIHRTLQEVRRRGKPGVRKLVGVLDELGGEPPPTTELERLLDAAVSLTGLRAVRQHPLPTHQPIRGLVDVAIVESKIILEADGRTWHSREQSMANDRRRDREAARLGWLTLRFMYLELSADPEGCAEDILTTHRLRSSV